MNFILPWLQMILMHHIKKHSEMGCICYENKKMGLYFINDPDEYWIEILPKR